MSQRQYIVACIEDLETYSQQDGAAKVVTKPLRWAAADGEKTACHKVRNAPASASALRALMFAINAGMILKHMTVHSR